MRPLEKDMKHILASYENIFSSFSGKIVGRKLNFYVYSMLG